VNRDEQISEYRMLLVAERNDETKQRTIELMRSFGVHARTFEDELVHNAVTCEDDLHRDVVSLVVSHCIDDIVEDPSFAEVLRFVAGALFEDDKQRLYMVEGFIAEQLGQMVLAIEKFKASLKLTQPDEPVYLTHVFTLYCAYLDTEQPTEAEALVASLPEPQQSQFRAEVCDASVDR